MDQPSRTELSPDDAILLHISTLARHYARLLPILGDDDELEDIAQDVVCACLVALRSGNGIPRTFDIASFVRMMVVRRAIDSRRRTSRRKAREAAHMAELVDMPRLWMSPEAALEAEEAETFLQRAIATLPPVCRRVYLMVREDGYSYQSVATALGISRNTVREHLVAAQKRLRTELAPVFHLGVCDLARTRWEVFLLASNVSNPRSKATERVEATAA